MTLADTLQAIESERDRLRDELDTEKRLHATTQAKAAEAIAELRGMLSAANQHAATMESRNVVLQTEAIAACQRVADVQLGLHTAASVLVTLAQGNPVTTNPEVERMIAEAAAKAADAFGVRSATPGPENENNAQAVPPEAKKLPSISEAA